MQYIRFDRLLTYLQQNVDVFLLAGQTRQLVEPGSVLTTLKRLARERDAFLWAGLGCSAGFVAICALSLVFGQQTIRRSMHVIMMMSCIVAVSPKRRAVCYRGTFSRIALCSFAGVDQGQQLAGQRDVYDAAVLFRELFSRTSAAEALDVDSCMVHTTPKNKLG